VNGIKLQDCTKGDMNVHIDFAKVVKVKWPCKTLLSLSLFLNKLFNC